MSQARRPDLSSWWYRKARDAFLRHHWICYWCRRPLRFDVPPRHRLSPTVDHRIEVVLGVDPMDQSNWVPAHFGCNSARSANVTRGKLRRSEVW